MDPFLRDLERLELQIDRLKREYDLFLAGRRKGEPAAFREEVEREVLRMTRVPVSSTAARFRAKSLAHRFQAVATQVRNLCELREARRKGGGSADEEEPSVLLDRAALESPASVEARVQRLHATVTEALGGAPPPSLDAIRSRLLEEARRHLGQPGVLGVRFTVVTGEGRPRIRGEVIRAPEDGEE